MTVGWALIIIWATGAICCALIVGNDFVWDKKATLAGCLWTVLVWPIGIVFGAYEGIKEIWKGKE